MSNIKTLKKYYPLKKYGQNFLINRNTIKNIIEKINPDIDQTLIEIGPGLAALTRPICELLKELVVIEIDDNLLNFLKKQSFASKLVVFSQDALSFNYTKFFHKKNKLIRIFGNLPYNISTALIIFLFKHITVIQDMHFMLQKEVVERLIALPGSKSYGRLSIISQYYCNIKILLNVVPAHFWPVPKVDSMFINLTPYDRAPYFVYDVNILSMITNKAFQKRRKMLRHSLKDLFSEIILLKLDIDPKLRAENISISQYCQLANYLYKEKRNSI